MRRGRPAYIHSAKGRILRFFEASKERVFTADRIVAILDENRAAWNLPQRMSGAKFIRFLTDNGNLREIAINNTAHPEKGPITRYVWGVASPFHIALSLRHKSYLCHSSAAFLLGLSDVVPRRIYANAEQSPKPANRANLTQNGIDLAFRRPQRQSNQIFEFGENSVVILNGKHSGNFEVGEVELLDDVFTATRLERTLIDLTVRPAYAGGTSQVLEAFRRAKGLASTMKITAVLKRLNYTYPYHQAVGFYMERAGFRSEQSEKLREFGLHYDFYLAHNMKEADYDSRWRIFFPKGL